QIDDEPGGERGAAARSSVAEELDALVEVVSRLDQVPLVEQRQPDVLLQQRISLRIAAPSMQGEVDARRFPEEPKRLRGSRCASRLRTRLEQIVLRLLEVLGPRIVVGQHAVVVGEALAEERFYRLG